MHPLIQMHSTMSNHRVSSMPLSQSRKHLRLRIPHSMDYISGEQSIIHLD